MDFKEKMFIYFKGSKHSDMRWLKKLSVDTMVNAWAKDLKKEYIYSFRKETWLEYTMIVLNKKNKSGNKYIQTINTWVLSSNFLEMSFEMRCWSMSSTHGKCLNLSHALVRPVGLCRDSALIIFCSSSLMCLIASAQFYQVV